MDSVCYVCLDGPGHSLVSLGCPCGAGVHPGCAADWYSPRVRVQHAGCITEVAWRLRFSCSCCVCSEHIDAAVASFLGEITRAFMREELKDGIYEVDSASVRACTEMYFDLMNEELPSNKVVMRALMGRWERAQSSVQSLAKMSAVLARAVINNSAPQLFCSVMRSRRDDADALVCSKLDALTRIAACVLFAHVALIIGIVVLFR